LGTNGIFVFTGVPGRKGPVEVDTDLMMRNLVLKNQVVFGTVNAGRNAFEASIRDIAAFLDSWPDAVQALITGRFPMEAHRDLLLGRSGGIKNVIKLNGVGNGRVKTMSEVLKNHWPEYVIEGACLGLFMISAFTFATI